MEKISFERTKKIKDFTKKCLKNECIYDYKGSIEIINNYWEQAKSVDKFIELVLGDKRLQNNQGYWQLAKENRENYKNLLRKYLGSKTTYHFTTESDIGSLKIGTKDFTYNIPNCFGDGCNDIYIIEDKIDIQCANFLTTIKGRFNIYDYDCGNNVAKELVGEYAIYREERLFIFVKWSD